MVIDKTDPTGQRLYVGSTTSGVFYSPNLGSKWFPLNDQGTVRNISYMAQAFDGTIFVGTGEGFLRPTQRLKAQSGTGLYKLSGSSLVSVASSTVTGTVINRIACHPTDKDIVALATNRGILVSTDGGNSFNVASIPSATLGVTTGIDVKFSSGGQLFCSIGSAEGTGTLNSVPTKVFRSNDNTYSAFTDITPTNAVLSDNNYGRIELAIAPSNSNVIYASCARKYVASGGGANNTASLQALFVSDNAGTNWGLILQGSPQNDPLSNGGTSASGDYAHVIKVNPTNPGQLFIGAFSFAIWTKTSASYNTNPIGIWTEAGSPFAVNTQFFLNQNIHDIELIGNNSPMFYFITDAGIFRSIDMLAINQGLPPTFQPFYKGLVTGQFNSVSIESYPLADNTDVPGAAVVPYSGFIGGTSSNGMTYYSGKDSLVTSEITYLNGAVYNVEYSKILPDAAMITVESGGFYRSTNARSSPPTLVNINTYSGPLSRVAPTAADFSNSGYNSTGTPFKMWENHGQLSNGPDKIYFYNDSLRLQASMIGLSTLTTQTTFTFSAARPNKFALIDSIVIRTGTVVLPISGPAANSPAFTGSDRKDLFMNFNKTYTVPVNTSSAVITAPAFTLQGAVGSGPSGIGPYGPSPSSGALHGATLNSQSLVDNISVTFTAPPFANKTQTVSGVPDPSAYYRVFATVFYRYKAGDTITVVDNNISTRTTSYTAALSNAMNWRYGTAPVYTITATSNTSVPNPTFVLTPGNLSQSSPVFTISTWLPATYTVSQNGTYSLNAIPVEHTLTAANVPTNAVSYTLFPGAITQTSGVFVVTPTTTTNYTITADNGTVTADTYSTIGASTFVLNPGNVSQATPDFVVTPTANTTYTVQGLSSNTLTGVNTSTTYATLSVKTTSTVGNTTGFVAFAPNNDPQKISMIRSARLAMALNQQNVTGGANAIVVCKSPLNLNDPLNFVRISQSGCLTDNASGVPTNSTISILGKPTLIEWSHSGTELYFATDSNRIYRVSHITDIMDLSPSSYSGKFFTDVFAYNNSGAPNANTINPVSPYRTTMIGAFTRPITSMNISNDDNFMAVTFNNPTPTGTTAIVMYNSNSIKTSNTTNINWSKKDGTGLSNLITYCALMEKNDNKRLFIGTDNGMYYTSDVTAASPNWQQINNNQLPNVQIFDIEQQQLDYWQCYNSGQIYVATFGRGIWTNNAYFEPLYVSVPESPFEKRVENDITMYPNPTNGQVTIEFESQDRSNANIRVFDLNGRLVKTAEVENNGSGTIKTSIDTGDLKAGIYIVNVSGDGIAQRAAKLIVTK